MGYEFLSNLIDYRSWTFGTIAAQISSIIAFAALLYTIRFKRRDVTRANANEFHDLVTEISLLREKKENLAIDLNVEPESAKYRKNMSILNDRADLLLSRADMLLNDGLETTDVCMKTIGGMLLELGRAGEAAEKHKIAIELSSSPLKAALNRRSYGRSVILSGRCADGRANMLNAVEELDSLDESSCDPREKLYYIIGTYQSLIDAQIRIKYRNSIKDDYLSLKELVDRVDEIGKKSSLDKSIVRLQEQVKSTFPGFAF